MSILFQSVGSVVALIAPVQATPPSFVVGQQVIVFTGEFLGADVIAAPGAPWIELSADNTAPQLRAFGMTSVTGAEPMPIFNWSGTNRGWTFASVWSGMDPGFASAFAPDDRNSNQKQNIVGPGASHLPSIAGSAIFLFGTRNKTSVSNGTIYSAPAAFTAMLQQLANGGTQPSIAAAYWLQGAITNVAANQSINGTVAETVTQSLQSSLFSVQPAAATVLPPGGNEYPYRFPARAASQNTRESTSMSIELMSIIPAKPMVSTQDYPNPAARIYPPSLRSIEQNLLESTLFNQDRVLVPVDWEYGWDVPLARMPVALRSDSYGLTAMQLSALTNFAPYIEYNWPVPMSPRQWHRGYEFGLNLNLFGKDQTPTSGFQNNMWDPPKGKAVTVHQQDTNSRGLSLFFTIPLKPPLSEANQPVPPHVRLPVQDFVAGIPPALLASLTVFPPFLASTELPPRRAQRSVELLSFLSPGLSLARSVPLPPGMQIDLQPRPAVHNIDLFSIGFFNPFITPVAPPITGSGVKHMGRVVLDPCRVGESVIVPMDFISGLAAGEFLVSGQALATVYTGTDPNPQNIVTGGMTFSGSIANQQVTPPFVGVIYTLLFKVITSDGNLLELAGYFAIEPVLP